jgi:hypothetical protein
MIAGGVTVLHPHAAAFAGMDRGRVPDLVVGSVVCFPRLPRSVSV